MKHSEYVERLQSLGEASLKKVFIKWVVKRLPFFAAGPLNYLLVAVASEFAEEAVEEAEIGIFFQYMDFRVDGQAEGFEKAMEENHKAQIEGDKDAKKNAEDVLDRELFNLWNLRK